jgi:hypothetical protein
MLLARVPLRPEVLKLREMRGGVHFTTTNNGEAFTAMGKLVR